VINPLTSWCESHQRLIKSPVQPAVAEKSKRNYRSSPAKVFLRSAAAVQRAALLEESEESLADSGREPEINKTDNLAR
jgi:hypothetical protein